MCDVCGGAGVLANMERCDSCCKYDGDGSARGAVWDVLCAIYRTHTESDYPSTATLAGSVIPPDLMPWTKPDGHKKIPLAELWSANYIPELEDAASLAIRTMDDTLRSDLTATQRTTLSEMREILYKSWKQRQEQKQE